MQPSTAEVADAFYRHLDGKVLAALTSPKTLDFYRSQLPKLLAIAGSVPAADLRPHHIVSLTMTNHLARSIKRLTRWAASEDFIPKDPFARMEVPPCGERQRTLTAAEMVKLYMASTRAFRRYLFLMRHTIARPGEIRDLTWADVDLEARVISLREFKAKKRRRDKARVRIIPLDRVATSMLIAMRRRTNPSPGDHVLRNRRGRALTANAVRCSMRRARDAAGLVDDGERIVCTTIRHTGATNATNNGIPQKILAELMGHTRTSTTERYQHVKSDHLVAVIDTATDRADRRRLKVFG